MEAGAASVSCSPLCVFPCALGSPERAHFTQTTRHQTTRRYFCDDNRLTSAAHRKLEAGLGAKKHCNFLQRGKSGRGVVTSWRERVTGSRGGDAAVERWLRLMQRLQRLNNLHLICNPIPFSLKSLWAKLYSKQMKVICWVSFFFPFFQSFPQCRLMVRS